MELGRQWHENNESLERLILILGGVPLRAVSISWDMNVPPLMVLLKSELRDGRSFLCTQFTGSCTGVDVPVQRVLHFSI